VWFGSGMMLWCSRGCVTFLNMNAKLCFSLFDGVSSTTAPTSAAYLNDRLMGY
jgi:hypothetical protein